MGPAERLWLRQHAPAERRLAKDLADYFRRQARRIAAAIRRAGDTPDVDQVFRADDEHERLIETVHPHLVRGMVLGAELERATVPGVKDRLIFLSAVKQDRIEIGHTDLPPEVLARIAADLSELEAQPYWHRIQSTTAARLTLLIEQAIADGDRLPEIVSSVEQALGGGARSRATAIARSETTGALNAGHVAQREELIDAGLVRGSEWLAILDSRVREAHAAMDGTIVGKGQDFVVDGEPTPYPGHYSLSAENRVNCRCTSVAAF